jgi:hypothetical protein
MTAATGVISILESTFNSLDLDTILALYADDARFTAHCEFLFPLSSGRPARDSDDGQ